MDDVPALLGCTRLGGRLDLVHHSVDNHPIKILNIASKTAMYAPTTALITKTSTVRLRVCSRVGQVTFFNSDHASSRKRRRRRNRFTFSLPRSVLGGRGGRTRTCNRRF